MILITRPILQANHTAKKLQAKGFLCKLLPMLEIIKLEVTISNPYDYVITTSQNAANCLEGGNKKACVVGDRSRQILESKGYQVVCTAPTAAFLYQTIIRNIAPSSRMLYASGGHVAYPLAQKLERQRYIIEEIIVYRSVATTSLPQQALTGITKILFYSPRTAQIFSGLCKEPIGNIEAICISQNTADRLTLNFKNIKIASHPNESSMLELV